MNSLITKVIKMDDNIDNVLTRFKITDATNNSLINPIILRTGGIGDLIALSSVASYIPDKLNVPAKNMKFVSQEKYRAIFQWFKYPINFVSYFAPVSDWSNTSLIARKRSIDNNRPIFFEGVIENSKINWFDLQYEQIGIKLDTDYGRPMLKTKRINDKPSNIVNNKKSILINPRSTAIIRSMRFEDIYNAIVKIVGNADINIYVHSRNLVPADKDFIVKTLPNDNRIKVINATSLDQFFLDAYDADLTISVDTAILHFREGVEKPAIGIYGPFPFECRTKYYKYIHSFNIKSSCNKMPCFIHVKGPDEVCDVQKKLIENKEFDEKYFYTAPCCCQSYNNTVDDQLYENMKDYILHHLQL